MDIIKSIAVRCLDEGSSTAENRGDFMTVSRRPLLLGLSVFAFAGGASAQEAGIEGASPDYGDEIVVTARKRTETVQDVPTSIRSLSGAELGKLGADGIEDIAGQAPGLTVSGNRASAQIFMRGVSTRSEEHTSELQSLMRISYAVLCLKKKNTRLHQ